MDNTLEAGTDASLKGKSFDEATALLIDSPEFKCVVQKKPAEGGRWAHCFSFRPGEYNEGELLDTIVAEYGPGDYPVQFKGPDEKGRSVIRWAQHMSVQQKRLSAQVAPTAPATTAPDSGLAMIAAALEQNSRILSGLVERLSAAPPAEKQKDTLEIAKDLAALKELFAPEKTSPMESIKEILEVMALLQNNGPTSDDPLTAALKAIVPAISKGQEAAQQRQAAQPAIEQQVIPAPAVVNAAQRVPAVPIQQSEELNVGEAYDFFAKNFLKNALELARAGQTPRDVAEYLLRLIGTTPAMVDMVGRVIAEDNMIERLTAANPAVIEYAAWFDEVADWLAHALWPDTNPAPDAENATDIATPTQGRNGSGITARTADGIDRGDSDGDLNDDGERIDDAHSLASRPPRRNDS